MLEKLTSRCAIPLDISQFPGMSLRASVLTSIVDVMDTQMQDVF